ncbi:transcription-repair coupling factor [Aliifodinibius sp. S!AR15-10]|uniref:transcription-repair coupling factor n=1 Tax=Aliifodinibius sp. S!AR15-10 TaxID=2950437 RepID=UPI0028614A72|nr:transcription-repair coupling factor [Aliifodinibius sp. S!AR15-10]MDR8390150.1 transcription-repair coupling factor [Aliifodinibius sp. S!AR15-10]
MVLNNISNTFHKAIPWSRLRDQIKQKNTIFLDHFVGSTSSLMVHQLSKEYDEIIAISADFESAQFLKSDLEELESRNPLLFPPTNHKPYDQQQIIDSGLMVQRSEVLEKIQTSDRFVTVTSSSALFEKIAAPETFSAASIAINKGDEVDFEKLKEELVDQEYKHVKFVDEPGEFASRGGIVDIFPYSGEYPIRLEFFGDEVDSIRQFDPDSQRSISHLNTVRIVPDATNLTVGHKESLLTYFDNDTLFLFFNQSLIRSDIGERFKKAETAYQELEDQDEFPEPGKAFLSAEEFDEGIAGKAAIHFGGFSSQKNIDWDFRLNATPQPDFNGSIKLLKENIRDLTSEGIQTYILCDNEGQRDRFAELLDDPDDDFRYTLAVNTLHQGFILKDQEIAVYTDHQIFNRYHRPKMKKRRYHGGISFKELRDLSVGDYVVHVDYGIGKFAGFRKIKIKGVEQESVVLKYKEDSVLYVNVSSLHKLQKYSGKEGTKPRISKLGSGRWARKKAQTKKKVKDIARDLIKLYAERKSKDGYEFSPDTSWQTELEARFEYEETPDQMESIKAVKKDMESSTPMDRLVCGDVGFGKTEVALRAAFKAVNDHKQVAILVPTTILAEQHYNTFSERMKHFPVEVDMLSRFRTSKEQKETINKLEEGKVDIIIGTHRITSKDIKFKELGLLIVDEEQRFGVSAKEKLKEYRATVDVLTLTATPIPRTLQFSLMGARDLSIINTPPPNRQPVRTEIHSFNEELISDAIRQEMSRGGQVFFIHNRVKNIEEIAEMVRRLVPDVRVRFAHGQMASSKLEKIIADFYHHKFDVLVSTNIVENGIDISNANTMIINRADHFGMAELHQLRGRVGRSNRKAFCYLITPPVETLTDEARKRLLALEEFSDLGAGFNLAMRDLDIRGAGDILGAEQSGFINDVGFDLYHKILNDAIKELKKEEFSDVFEDVEVETELPETTVEFDVAALLPSRYISDNIERLNLYRKLAQATKEEEIDDWEEEVRDRFGPIPEEGQHLITAAKIKLFASHNFITKVTVRSNRMWLKCPKNSSELGEEFYGNKFQPLLKALQEHAADRMKVIQKDERVRFVIHDIADIKAAATFLKMLKEATVDEDEKVVVS